MFETTDGGDPPTRTIDILNRGLKAIVAGIRREAWIRAEIARASALDDHILADIAVCRREIRHAVRGRISRLETVVRD